MKEILEIINPIGKLKVEDFGEIAKILEVIDDKKDNVEYEPDSILPLINYKARAYMLMSRYESLTSQLLRKEMFVNTDKQDDLSFAEFDRTAWKEKEEKVWFDGFEAKPLSDNMRCYTSGINQVTVYFGGTKCSVWIGDTEEQFTNLKSKANCTVYDLIYHISKYNETAKEPIRINFTENFLKQLLK